MNYETMSELPEQLELNEAESAEIKPRRKWWVYVVWAGVAALILFLGYGLLHANETRPEVGKQAPTSP